MQIEQRSSGDVAIVGISGDITLSKGGDVLLKDKIQSLLQQGHRKIVLDMGNVSYAVPSIHPIIGIDSAPAVNHQPEFTAAAATPAADQALLDGAIALAWTAIDAATDPEVRSRLLER